MRRSPLSVALTPLATVVATSVPIVAMTAAVTAAPTASAATATQPYTWQNVKIGGGGFIDGIEFSPAQQNLLYAHTDIGRAHPWEHDPRAPHPPPGSVCPSQLGRSGRD